MRQKGNRLRKLGGDGPDMSIFPGFAADAIRAQNVCRMIGPGTVEGRVLLQSSQNEFPESVAGFGKRLGVLPETRELRKPGNLSEVDAITRQAVRSTTCRI